MLVFVSSCGRIAPPAGPTSKPVPDRASDSQQALEALATDSERQPESSPAPTLVSSDDDYFDLDELPKDRLDAKKQKFIWDSEHITFKIEHRFGKQFKTAWKAKDHDSLCAIFADDFSGLSMAPDQPSSEKRTALVTAIERNQTAGGLEVLDPQQMANALVGHLSPFDKVNDVGLRVLKIDQRVSTGEAESWTAEILLTAQGHRDDGDLLAFDSLQNVEFHFNDSDQLGDPHVVTQWKVNSTRLRSCPQMLMEEVTQDVGFAELPLVDNWETSDSPQQFQFQMAVEDFDRDGYLDIAIATTHGTPLLLKSVNGKAFEDVTKEFAFKAWSPQEYRYLAAWLDFDNDGFADLILGRRLYRNVGGTSFEDVTESSGLRFGERPMGCTIADYDVDGLLDIYV